MNDRMKYQIAIEQRIRVGDYLYFKDDLNEIIYNNTIIHCASTNARILKLLLSHGGNPNVKTNDGETILQTMKEYNKLECVQIIEEWLDIPTIKEPCE